MNFKESPMGFFHIDQGKKSCQIPCILLHSHILVFSGIIEVIFTPIIFKCSSSSHNQQFADLTEYVINSRHFHYLFSSSVESSMNFFSFYRAFSFPETESAMNLSIFDSIAGTIPKTEPIGNLFYFHCAYSHPETESFVNFFSFHCTSSYPETEK